MTDIVLTILRYGLAVFVGFIAGVLISRGKTDGGHTVPIITKDDKNFTAVTVVLVIISLIAVVTTAVSVNQQISCNKEFRASLVVRSQIAREDNRLQDRLIAIGADDSAALREFLGKAIMAPPGDPNGQLPEDLIKFRERINDNSAERAKIMEEQANLEKQREEHPYPEPQCGDDDA